MTDKNGVGVTVISHNSENRTLVIGFEDPGSYSHDIQYKEADLLQLASLTSVSTHCEQFIKYECISSSKFQGNLAWWVSRDSANMTYWGGARPGSGKCACGMNSSCANNKVCNCDANIKDWSEDSGLLTDKTHLPVKQLRFRDTWKDKEEGYHTLGKFKCYGIAWYHYTCQECDYTLLFCMNQSKKVRLGKCHVQRIKLRDLMIINTEK